jgi:hypothetical protein
MIGSGRGPAAGDREADMKPFTTLAILVFAVVALAHIYRLVSPFDVIVGGTAIPIWASGIGALVAVLLAVMLSREARR